MYFRDWLLIAMTSLIVVLLPSRYRKKSKELKEAKRMVCDCTLPPLAERERGVMPCGEDCLNRMLMIEW